MLIEYLKVLILGIVEGITEWLPISSTGHMILVENFLRLDVSRDFWEMFLVVIQLGAIMAVVVIYFHKLNPFSPRKSAKEKSDTWQIWGKVIVGCLPAAIIGLPLNDWLDEHFYNYVVVAIALIVYGVIFIWIETKYNYRPTVQDFDQMSYLTAFKIGCFQVLSLIPGTSRSGSTIIGGLILGCSRTVVAEFTFYLAIPVMVGASGLRLVKYFLKGNVFAPMELAILLVGCAVAFVVSLVCIRFLMGFVRKHDFKPFGWYRIVLGVLVIAWFGITALL